MKEFKQYKIKAKDLQEKAEIIGLFEGLGYTKCAVGGDGLIVFAHRKGALNAVLSESDINYPQITIEQLREMSMKDYLLEINGEYVLHTGRVVPCGGVKVGGSAGWANYAYKKKNSSKFIFALRPQCDSDLVLVWQRNEPQKKKEYLNPCKGGGYELSDFPICEDSIEVPDGAESFNYFGNEGNVFFLKNNSEITLYSNETEDWAWKDWGDIDFDGVVCLWQRSKTESVPQADELNVTAWGSQIGGSHYKDYAIQPLEFALANNLDAAQHAVVKYVMRHKDKNGIEDLKKAKHYIDLMIEHYY